MNEENYEIDFSKYRKIKYYIEGYTNNIRPGIILIISGLFLAILLCVLTNPWSLLVSLFIILYGTYMIIPKFWNKKAKFYKSIHQKFVTEGVLIIGTIINYRLADRNSHNGLNTISLIGDLTGATNNHRYASLTNYYVYIVKYTNLSGEECTYETYYVANFNKNYVNRNVLIYCIDNKIIVDSVESTLFESLFNNS